MRTLYLASPHLTGDDVTRLQVLLDRHHWLRGNIDGDYGIQTAQAVYRAKYWLGYEHPDQVAGDLLVSYLDGSRKQGPKMRDRVKARMHPEGPPLRQKALNHLTGKLGTKEHPAGSNICWASVWYGIGPGPWCAMAVSWAYVEAGSRVFLRTQRYAYVPYIVADARMGRNNLAVTNQPQPGDLVCYDWGGDGVADHVGLFERWASATQGALVAIEGNTSVGNDSNGGEVMRRNRTRSDVQVFVHVGA